MAARVDAPGLRLALPPLRRAAQRSLEKTADVERALMMLFVTLLVHTGAAVAKLGTPFPILSYRNHANPSRDIGTVARPLNSMLSLKLGPVPQDHSTNFDMSSRATL